MLTKPEKVQPLLSHAPYGRLRSCETVSSVACCGWWLSYTSSLMDRLLRSWPPRQYLSTPHHGRTRASRRSRGTHWHLLSFLSEGLQEDVARCPGLARRLASGASDRASSWLLRATASLTGGSVGGWCERSASCSSSWFYPDSCSVLCHGQVFQSLPLST